MTINILLINVHSSKNIGDAALLQATINQINETFPDAEINISIDDPESHSGPEHISRSFFSWVHPFSGENKVTWSYFRLLFLVPITLIPLLFYKISKRKSLFCVPIELKASINDYLDADLVISKPGGFLYSSGLGTSLFIAIYSILYAHWAGKPVYLFPQSIGPLHHSWEYFLVRKLLNRVRIIMVREPISHEIVTGMKLKNHRLFLLPDLAFTIPSEGQEAGKFWLKQNGIDFTSGNPLLGMTIINWGAQNATFSLQQDYEQACVNAIKYFIETLHGLVILFPHVYGPLESQDDRIPAHRIAEQLPALGSSIKVIDRPMNAELIKSIYGLMDIFVGTRMHSNIFALSEGVPVVAIGYLHKTKGIAQMLGIERWVLDIKDAKNDELTDKIAELWLARNEWRKKIVDKLPDVLEQARMPGKLVSEDYFKNWVVNRRG